MIIYKITNKVNGKIYIGKDSRNDPSYLGSGTYIQKAIRKYGKKNFVKEILEECPNQEILSKQEIYWIKSLHSTDRKIGYNVSVSGDGGNRNGAILSEEIRKKISESKIGTHWGHHTPETKKKMSSLRKGIMFTEEHKKHLSEKRKLRIITEKTREKTKKTSTGKINIKKYLLEDDSGKTYETNKGLNEFCREHNLFSGNLLKTLSGERTNHKGWKILRRLE